MRLKTIAAGAVAAAGVAWLAMPAVSSASTVNSAIPRYQHVFEIMMENTSYSTIIGNPLAPNLNALASQYGLATNYSGVTHPSEPNYVANIGGSFFGIQEDNPFWCTPALAITDPSDCGGTTAAHTITAQSLSGQLTAAGMTWRGYFQNLPPVPSSGVISSGPFANGPYTFKWPSSTDAFYASKHNPFLNFTDSQSALANMVPDTQLASDLASGDLANYSLIVPDQCHDMHGTGGCGTVPLISQGDTYVGSTVSAIMSSKAWQEGRNAIVITWDEDDFSDEGQLGTGCCGADPGGGHVVTIVITNKTNQYPITDNTPYNHYSLLLSIEDAFGLPCLANACDSADGVVPMTKLFHP